MLGLLALMALAAAVYCPILPGNFIMDDRRLVETDNLLVNGVSNIGSIWFQSDFPLSTLGLWAEHRLWGNNPLGGHLVNIALHAVSAMLIWVVLSKISNTRFSGWGWLAAVLFVVHPVCVATVARIAELKNTLSLPFFLLSVWSYLRYDELAKNSPRAGLWLGGSLFLFVLALMAKTSVVMLPVVLLLCIWWRRGRLTWPNCLPTVPFFAVGLSFGLMSIWFQKHQAIAGAVLAPETRAERLAIAGRVFWFYLGKALWPVNLNLVYPAWGRTGSLVPAYFPDALIVLVAAVCWIWRERWGRPVLLALGCFAALIFPALGFFDAQFLTHWQVSDHLQYLPLIAPVALAAAALIRLPRRRGQMTKDDARTMREYLNPNDELLPSHSLLSLALPAVLVVCLTVLSFQRARIFSNEEALFRDTLARNPSAWGVQNDLGVLLAARGAHEEAMTHFNAALSLFPDYAEAHINLGKLLHQQGNEADARDQFETALKSQPNHPGAHGQLGLLLAQHDLIADALPHLRAALLFAPDVPMRLKYAGLLYQTGDYREAVAQLRLALAAQPNSVEALNNLAWALATAPDEKLRNGAEAVRLAEKASALPAPKGICVPGTLAAAYAEAGRFKEAVATAEKAIAEETAAGQDQFAGVNRQLLALYRAGKPFHMPSAPGRHSNSIDDK